VHFDPSTFAPNQTYGRSLRPASCAVHISAFNVNVLGLLLTTQAAVKHLSEGASIINIGSVASRITPPNSAVYTGTKAAVDAITGVLARELGPKKIRVNTINPGVVETEGTHSGGVIGI
jgi:3-oxoacyl-[acyl-carrier protein] reductase